MPSTGKGGVHVGDHRGGRKHSRRAHGEPGSPSWFRRGTGDDMASAPTLQIRHILPPTALNLRSAAARSRFHRPSSRLLTSPPPSPPLPRAAGDANPGEGSDASEEEPVAPAAAGEPDTAFENRLAQVRLKYRSGTGKKAEQRRAKKSPAGTPSQKGGKAGAVMLPPVPLREPVSAGGMKVVFGFSPYSEWLNGRLAALGLVALLLVELGSGKGLLSYHAPPILFIQIYTVAAVSALFVKYEKERISVWPKAPPPSPAPTNVGDP